MPQESWVGIILTLATGFSALIALGWISRRQPSGPLKSLSAAVVFLNLIWWTALALYFLRPVFPGPKDPSKIDAFQAVLLSFLYVLRFGMMISLFSLFRRVLGEAVALKADRYVKRAAILLVVFWAVAWAEVPLLGGHKIADELMVLTDFMIFIAVILAAAYLRYRASRFSDREYGRAASLLGAIVIVPFAIGCIKLAVGPSLMKVSSLLERSLIYIFVSLFNVSAAAWAFKYGRIMGEQRSRGWPPADQAFNDFLESHNISKREGEVIRCLCEGDSNKDIAERLFISVETVKDHNYKIFQKTGVRNRVQLVRLVHELQKKAEPRRKDTSLP